MMRLMTVIRLSPAISRATRRDVSGSCIDPMSADETGHHNGPKVPSRRDMLTTCFDLSIRTSTFCAST